MIASIKHYLQKKIPSPLEKPVVAAYDAWSASYDSQPGNLMLDLDEQIFTELLKEVTLENKNVADIGCGTGRHWQKLYKKKPALVIGFDVSAGMLNQLGRKFPAAVTQQVTDNLLTMMPDGFADCIISTLTIAHIKNAEEAVAAWARVLKNHGDLIITDFHPEILAKGGKRSFNQEGKSFSVVNYVHPLEKLKSILNKYGFIICSLRQKYIDEKVKHWYEAQNALHVYNRFYNMPVIYGLHLKKQHGAQ